MSNITPGEWIVGEGRVRLLGFGRDYYFAVGIQSDEQLPNWLPVAILSRSDQVTEMDRANAALIAAAPELLAALRKIVQTGVGEWTSDPDVRYAINDARAVISKAEGRQ